MAGGHALSRLSRGLAERVVRPERLSSARPCSGRPRSRWTSGRSSPDLPRLPRLQAAAWAGPAFGSRGGGSGWRAFAGRLRHGAGLGRRGDGRLSGSRSGRAFLTIVEHGVAWIEATPKRVSFDMASVFAAAKMLNGGQLGWAYAGQAAAAAGACALMVLALRRGLGGRAEVALMAAAIPLATPYLLHYDQVILVVPLAWMLGEGRRTGFLPGERVALAVLLVSPAAAYAAVLAWEVPLAPLVSACVFAAVLRRGATWSRAARRTRRSAPARPWLEARPGSGGPGRLRRRRLAPDGLFRRRGRRGRRDARSRSAAARPARPAAAATGDAAGQDGGANPASAPPAGGPRHAPPAAPRRTARPRRNRPSRPRSAGVAAETRAAATARSAAGSAIRSPPAMLR